MLTRFDHIVKNALGNLMSSNVPDWDVFYDILQIEEDLMEVDETAEMELGDSLRDLEFTSSLPAWDLFETTLDDFNAGMDHEFDQSIGEALDHIPETTWGSGAWDLMSTRLDDLNDEMDAGFDRTVGAAMNNLPESSWKESHWQMLSSRLDRLNDKPRLLMMKVIEAAAILLLLVQLTNLYSGFQQGKNSDPNLTSYLRQILNLGENSTDSDTREFEWTDNSSSSPSDHERSETTINEGQSITDPSKDSPTAENNAESRAYVQSEQGGSVPDPNELSNDDVAKAVAVVSMLNPDHQIEIPYDYLRKVEGQLQFVTDHRNDVIIKAAPQLNNDPNLIAYTYNPNESEESSPRLDVRDISLLSTSFTDSILNSIPTLQVIRPRIHSSMEVGMLADATNVEIQDYFSLSGPYHESTLNPGGYFRYKIQYENIFGSLGADYLNIKYDGSSNDNKLTVVSLPVELGYNVVNIPSFRMYFSGGIAGRFVPTANYSTETFNQSSNYGTRSNKPSNGLLNNGPFEINSYLSGRLSMGLDINLNKKTSINLRFSHDIWLKGRGIGYNLDKFRSSHLAIGTNFHL